MLEVAIYIHIYLLKTKDGVLILYQTADTAEPLTVLGWSSEVG